MTVRLISLLSLFCVPLHSALCPLSWRVWARVLFHTAPHPSKREHWTQASDYLCRFPASLKVSLTKFHSRDVDRIPPVWTVWLHDGLAWEETSEHLQNDEMSESESGSLQTEHMTQNSLNSSVIHNCLSDHVYHSCFPDCIIFVFFLSTPQILSYNTQIPLIVVS